MPLTPREALENLGVTAGILTPEEKSFLDEHGYLPLGQVLSEELTSSIRTRLDDLARIEGDAAGSELHQEPCTVN